MRPVAALLLALVPAAAAQEVDAETAARIDKLVTAALEGRSIVRPQAADRLVALGEPAAARLRELAGETNADLAGLGKDLVAVLGRFDDADLRTRLWSAVPDSDFPWRPQAALSLAETAREDERERFVSLLADPLSTVRRAAVVACVELDLAAERERVRALLADPNDRVRRTAAGALDGWDEPGALFWVVEDLNREDRFFDLDTARLGRMEAIALLRERLGDDFGYRLDLPAAAPENRDAQRAIEARVLERADGERPELPEIARAGSATPTDALGLELRSCRRGEFFLRWGTDDVLRVGIGNARAIPLAEGTVAALLADADRDLAALEDERFWGAPGCDSETYHRRPADADRTGVWQLSKGPEAATDLRPVALDALALRLLETLPDAPDADPRIDRLRTRVRRALEVLGGDPESR